jgi:hypothetical protein
MKLAANAVKRTNGAPRPKATTKKKRTDSGVVPIVAHAETTPPPRGQRPDEPTEPASEYETPAIRARAFVHESLDDMDRLVGTIIGIIDDIDYQPSAGDRERVRKVAAMMRSRLTAAAGEMTSVIASDLFAEHTR